MLIVMTSPDAVLRNGKPDQSIVNILTNVRAANNPVGLISNHAEPDWFAECFEDSGVQFMRCKGRQSGEIISINSKKFELNPFDVLVLATKNEDVQMGKNGHAVLIAAGWSTDKQVTSLGIQVNNPKELQEIIDLMVGWEGHWWFSGDEARYRVRALSDLSSKYGKTLTQQMFAQKLVDIVKNGGSRLNALLAVTARSLMMDGFDDQEGLVWGVYPSSSSSNKDDEILSDFTHRLRTTVSRVRFSKRGHPLFIRHQPSLKRSMGSGGDRTDPSNQIQTIHLNPFYQESNRLVGKHVVIIDDCTTYGVSFGVASAFLRKAGAASISGVALGKFGGQLRYYEIDINTDPYQPVTSEGFTIVSMDGFKGNTSAATQHVLQALIP